MTLFCMNADGKFIENDTYSERQKDCIIFDASLAMKSTGMQQENIS